MVEFLIGEFGFVLKDYIIGYCLEVRGYGCGGDVIGGVILLFFYRVFVK